MVEVLQTNYRGIQYRSRAEARWALAFDEFGWTHFYEPETFLLPSGPYLPDFFLPQIGAYFEVKGRKPNAAELLKAGELCVSANSYVIVSSGPPNPDRNEWDNDCHTFSPECVDDEFYADEHIGGFVSGRRENHPRSSLHLGNLMHLPVLNDVAWQAVFRRAANCRFGIFEQNLGKH